MLERKIEQIYMVLTKLVGLAESCPELYAEMRTLEALMSPPTFTGEMVRELRNRTGEGLMACREALVQSSGDIELAITFLRRGY